MTEAFYYSPKINRIKLNSGIISVCRHCGKKVMTRGRKNHFFCEKKYKRIQKELKQFGGAI
jgi:hypothetical protein